MSRLQPTTPIIAIVYGEGARIAPTLDRVAGHLAANGLRLAGFVQHDLEHDGRSRCDMILVDLSTSETVVISQDRGEGARGCRLDVESLLTAVMRTRVALATKPDLVIVNKFGKTECEGGGCRSLIVDAIDHDVPVLVAVPLGNLECWRRFAGDLATEYNLDALPIEGARLCRQLGLVARASQPEGAAGSDASALQ
jgi:nucleoside-triphosphatase THEP1